MSFGVDALYHVMQYNESLISTYALQEPAKPMDQISLSVSPIDGSTQDNCVIRNLDQKVLRQWLEPKSTFRWQQINLCCISPGVYNH